VDEGNWQYRAPAASAHTDACRVLLFNWRLRNAGLPAVNDVAAFPCGCDTTGGAKTPWRLEDADHPGWCVVPGEHAWTECTITQMIPKEDA
jgi:hypothetical protein